MSNTLFPVFLRLDRLNTLVVGGGNVALEKVSALLRNSPEARVTMVAPFYREELLAYLNDYPMVERLERAFDFEDLDMTEEEFDWCIEQTLFFVKLYKSEHNSLYTDTSLEFKFFLNFFLKKFILYKFLCITNLNIVLNTIII